MLTNDLRSPLQHLKAYHDYSKPFPSLHPEYSSIAASSVRRKLTFEAVALASIIVPKALFMLIDMIAAKVYAPLTKSITSEMITIHTKGFCSLYAS